MKPYVPQGQKRPSSPYQLWSLMSKLLYCMHVCIRRCLRKPQNTLKCWEIA